MGEGFSPMLRCEKVKGRQVEVMGLTGALLVKGDGIFLRGKRLRMIFFRDATKNL
jgi:hypothetical protein